MLPAAVPEARNSCSVYPYGASANWLVSAGACNLDPVVPSGPEKVTADREPALRSRSRAPAQPARRDEYEYRQHERRDHRPGSRLRT